MHCTTFRHTLLNTNVYTNVTEPPLHCFTSATTIHANNYSKVITRMKETKTTKFLKVTVAIIGIGGMIFFTIMPLFY